MFMNFINGIKNGAYDFVEAYEYIKSFLVNLWNAEHIVPLRDTIWNFVVSFSSFLPYIALAACLLVAIFGKRMFGCIRFLFFFSVGFALGAYLLSPLVIKVIPQIPIWLTALVTGVVAAVMSKLLYILTVIAIPGYFTYMVCFTGTLIPALTGFTQGKMVVSVVVAAVVVVILLVLLKYIEMLGTAALGGLGIAYIAKRWYDYTSLDVFAGKAWIAILIVCGIVAVIGFVVQFRTRKRF